MEEEQENHGEERREREKSEISLSSFSCSFLLNLSFFLRFFLSTSFVFFVKRKKNDNNSWVKIILAINKSQKKKVFDEYIKHNYILSRSSRNAKKSDQSPSKFAENKNRKKKKKWQAKCVATKEREECTFCMKNVSLSKK